MNELFLTPAQGLEQVLAAASDVNNDPKVETTLGKTVKPSPQKSKPAPTRNHHGLIPESIAYLVRQIIKGKNLSMEDKHTLCLIAGSYKEGLTPFIHLHIRTFECFTDLLRTAKYLTEDPTDKSEKKSMHYLDEALELLIEFPFLMTTANVTAMDAVLFEKGAITRTMNRFQGAVTRETGFDFTTLNEGRWTTEEDTDLVAC